MVRVNAGCGHRIAQSCCGFLEIPFEFHINILP
jgi:hypothetical protein